MLELYHAPRSRSSRIISLLDELGALDKVEVKIATIPRQDGSGGRDSTNPHPEGKVPLLIHDGAMIRESNAIILYLTDMFPRPDFAPVIGDPKRGPYLSWLAYYGNIVEPVLLIGAAEVKHPILDATFRGIAEVSQTLKSALSQNNYLLGDTYTAADLLLSSPFTWFPAFTPDIAEIKSWVARCQEQASSTRTAAYDERALNPK